MPQKEEVDRREQAERILSECLSTASREGFFGVVTVQVHLSNGKIHHVEEQVRRVHK